MCKLRPRPAVSILTVYLLILRSHFACCLEASANCSRPDIKPMCISRVTDPRQYTRVVTRQFSLRQGEGGWNSQGRQATRGAVMHQSNANRKSLPSTDATPAKNITSGATSRKLHFKLRFLQAIFPDRMFTF